MPFLKANHERPVELLALACVSVEQVHSWTNRLLRIGLPDGADGSSGSGSPALLESFECIVDKFSSIDICRIEGVKDSKPRIADRGTPRKPRDYLPNQSHGRWVFNGKIPPAHWNFHLFVEGLINVIPSPSRSGNNPDGCFGCHIVNRRGQSHHERCLGCLVMENQRSRTAPVSPLFRLRGNKTCPWGNLFANRVDCLKNLGRRAVGLAQYDRCFAHAPDLSLNLGRLSTCPRENALVRVSSKSAPIDTAADRNVKLL